MLETDELKPAINMILGRPFPKWRQKTLDISWTTLNNVLRRITKADWITFNEAYSDTGDIGNATKIIFENAKLKKQTQLAKKQLTVIEVRTIIETIASIIGSGSKERKEHIIETLFSQASPIEAKYLVKIFVGEMRTGFHEGLMEHAIAKAFDVPLLKVQNASMALGDIGEVAVMARTQGKQALSNIRFRVFRPVKPMLAQVASNVEEVLEVHGGETAFEYKYDGARIQIHK